MQYEINDKKRVKGFVAALTSITKHNESFTMILDESSVSANIA